jgi:hypothetical protein
MPNVRNASHARNARHDRANLDLRSRLVAALWNDSCTADEIEAMRRAIRIAEQIGIA